MSHPRMNNSRSPIGRPRHGFTLIELMLVVVLLGIVAKIAIPKIDITAFRADAGARVVGTSLNFASRVAVLRQHDVIVSFDQAGARLRVVEDVNSNGLVDTGERTTYKPMEDGVNFYVLSSGVGGVAGGSPAAAVNGTTLKTINSMPSIVFHRDGAASSDVEAYISSKRQKNTDYRAVTITKATGRVSSYRYTANGWQRSGV